VLSEIPEDLPLRGVVHAAGVLDDGVLTGQSAERFERVMAPKVRGALHLDALTRECDLDFFVMFSSAAGTFGAAGQGSYAAANAVLDGLASRRRAEGLAGLSLAWGLWTDATGQAAGLASGVKGAQQGRQDRSGLGAVTPTEGMALFEAAMGRSEAQLLPVPMHLGALRKGLGDAIPPFWRALVHPARRVVQAKRSGWADEVCSLSPRQREEVVLKTVRAEVARVLSMGNAEVVVKDRPLKELGLDSLMAVELRNALGKRVGKTLPATLAFDYPSPSAIVTYIVENVLGFRDATRAAETVGPSDVGLDIETVRHLSDEEAVTRVQRELRAAFWET
jgi:epothilone polyketide synthase D